MKFPTVDEAIAYLNKFQFHGFRLGLERIDAVLDALGNPHETYPTIHVAGTNGKGSVCAALSSILQEAGYKVGFYSSPHLVKLNERFRINMEPIDDSFLKELLEETASLSEKGYELSYFEFTTAMAFSCFAKKGVDIAIIETGLGGRLDATNVITPLISIITNISLEHQTYLGNTVEEIAFEKGGIIKKGVPVVTGRLDGGPLKVISRICQEKEAPLHLFGRDFGIKRHGDSALFDLWMDNATIKNVRFGLMGKVQMENGAVAAFVCRLLERMGLSVSQSDIVKGLAKTYWPGRSELFKGSCWVFMDGAHNLAGLESLRNSLQQLETLLPGIGKKSLLWACSNEGGDKDPVKMLQTIAPLFKEIIITEPQGPRLPVTIEEWANMDTPDGVTLVKDYREALDVSLSALNSDDLLVVAGSLYLVGPVRERLIARGFKHHNY